MKLPRDVTGRDLVKAFQKIGYVIIRQKGSHIRMTGNIYSGKHHITITEP